MPRWPVFYLRFLLHRWLGQAAGEVVIPREDIFLRAQPRQTGTRAATGSEWICSRVCASFGTPVVWLHCGVVGVGARTRHGGFMVHVGVGVGQCWQ